jgi:hypothetical protein
VPFLADVPWEYQDTPELVAGLRSGLTTRFAAWEARPRDTATAYGADKRQHPVFTVYGGPGSGKSRLLSELHRLASAAVRDNSALFGLLEKAFVFHVGFENGTRYQIAENDGAVAVGNRMMWQLVRPRSSSHSAVDFLDFTNKHRYSISDALNKLSSITMMPRDEQPVFLLIDGVHNLRVPEASPAAFLGAVDAISTIVCGRQFIVGALAATAGSELERVFGSSQQERILLRPPLLPNPELVVPDDPDFPALRVLRDDMGGHGRALDILATLVKARESPGSLKTIDALSHAVQGKLRSSFDKWVSVQPVEPLLEAIVSRRPFRSLSDVVVGTMTVDDVRELGLVYWAGSVSAPGPLVAPVILLLMLKSNLSGLSLLSRLASGYNKLEFGTREGTWWQDFEVFVALFRAIKARAFRDVGWVSIAQLHYGAKLSSLAQNVFVRAPRSVNNATVVVAAMQYPTRLSGAVSSVRPKLIIGSPSLLVRKDVLGAVTITDGSVIVVNGANAPAGDVFLDVEFATKDGFQYSGREVFACRHRETDVSGDDFELEYRKAADIDNLFLFFTAKSVDVELSDSSEGTPLPKKVSAHFHKPLVELQI